MAERSILDRLLGRPGAAPRQSVPVRQRIARGGPRAEYDGATFGRRAAGWRRTQRDANAELSPAVMAALRGIARDLVRNNPFAARGVATIANNMVGTGITFQVYRNGKIDDALNKKARAHFDTSACDSGGRHDLYGLQLQAARTIVESGAVVMRRRWRRLSDRLPLPVQLQVLEPDYIDPSKHGPARPEPPAVSSSTGFSSARSARAKDTGSTAATPARTVPLRSAPPSSRRRMSHTSFALIARKWSTAPPGWHLSSYA